MSHAAAAPVFPLGSFTDLYTAGCDFQDGKITAAQFQSHKQQALEALGENRELSFAGVLFHLRALRQSNILTNEEHSAGVQLARAARAQR
jgi:hypothetical protein